MLEENLSTVEVWVGAYDELCEYHVFRFVCVVSNELSETERDDYFYDVAVALCKLRYLKGAKLIGFDKFPAPMGQGQEISYGL